MIVRVIIEIRRSVQTKRIGDQHWKKDHCSKHDELVPPQNTVQLIWDMRLGTTDLCEKILNESERTQESADNSANKNSKKENQTHHVIREIP